MNEKKMTCGEVDEVLGLWVSADGEEAAAVASHLAECEACAEKVALMRGAAELVGAGVNEGEEPVLSEGRRESLMAAAGAMMGEAEGLGNGDGVGGVSGVGGVGGGSEGAKGARSGVKRARDAGRGDVIGRISRLKFPVNWRGFGIAASIGLIGVAGAGWWMTSQRGGRDVALQSLRGGDLAPQHAQAPREYIESRLSEEVVRYSNSPEGLAARDSRTTTGDDLSRVGGQLPADYDGARLGETLANAVESSDEYLIRFNEDGQVGQTARPLSEAAGRASEARVDELAVAQRGRGVSAAGAGAGDAAGFGGAEYLTSNAMSESEVRMGRELARAERVATGGGRGGGNIDSNAAGAEGATAAGRAGLQRQEGRELSQLALGLEETGMAAGKPTEELLPMLALAAEPASGPAAPAPTAGAPVTTEPTVAFVLPAQEAGTAESWGLERDAAMAAGQGLEETVIVQRPSSRFPADQFQVLDGTNAGFGDESRVTAGLDVTVADAEAKVAQLDHFYVESFDVDSRVAAGDAGVRFNQPAMPGEPGITSSADSGVFGVIELQQRNFDAAESEARYGLNFGEAMLGDQLAVVDAPLGEVDAAAGLSDFGAILLDTDGLQRGGEAAAGRRSSGGVEGGVVANGSLVDGEVTFNGRNEARYWFDDASGRLDGSQTAGGVPGAMGGVALQGGVGGGGVLGGHVDDAWLASVEPDIANGAQIDLNRPTVQAMPAQQRAVEDLAKLSDLDADFVVDAERFDRPGAAAVDALSDPGVVNLNTATRDQLSRLAPVTDENALGAVRLEDRTARLSEAVREAGAEGERVTALYSLAAADEAAPARPAAAATPASAPTARPATPAARPFGNEALARRSDRLRAELRAGTEPAAEAAGATVESLAAADQKDGAERAGDVAKSEQQAITEANLSHVAASALEEISRTLKSDLVTDAGQSGVSEYDIRDLLVAAPNFTNAPRFDLYEVSQDTNDPEVTSTADKSIPAIQEDQLEELVTEVALNGQQSGEASRESVEIKEGKLIVTGTSETQRRVAALIEQVRVSRANKDLFPSLNRVEAAGATVAPAADQKDGAERAGEGIAPERVSSLRRQQTVAEYTDAFNRSIQAAAEGKYDQAEEWAKSAVTIADQNERYLNTEEKEHMVSRAEQLAAEVDELQAKAEARQLAAQAAARGPLSIPDDRTREAAEREKNVQELLRRSFDLQKEGKPEEALQVVDQVLFVAPNNVAANAMKDSLEDGLKARETETLRGDGRFDAELAAVWDNNVAFITDLEPVVGAKAVGFDPSVRVFRSTDRVQNQAQKPIAVDFNQTPLRDVAVYFKEATGVDVELDWERLKAAGINEESLVTLRLASVPASHALSLIFDQIGGGEADIERVVRDGRVVVTTREAAEAMLRGEAVEIARPQAAPAAAPAPAVEEVEEEEVGELPAASMFREFPVNPWVMAGADRLSTFGIDVDRASYALSRRYIRGGVLPPRGAVRMEEFVNAFDYQYPSDERRVFAVHGEMGRTVYGGEGLSLLKVGVKARAVGREDRKPAHLVLVVDASGSMDRADRLPLVKRAMGMLVGALGEGDRVSLVTYGTRATLVMEAAAAERAGEVVEAMEAIGTGGSTNLVEGVKVGYEVARRQFRSGYVNRVVLCTDGVANVGEQDAETILSEIDADRRQGITLTVAGFGAGGLNDGLLEELANKGDGEYLFIDSEGEARRRFVEELGSTLETVALDAKIQVEFNAARVRRWRLIGYENRDIADRDFRNDAVDAGEVGSGQAASALYELELTGDETAGEVGTVRVRYKDVETGAVTEIEEKLTGERLAVRSAEARARFELAASAAEFAEQLRESDHARGRSLDEIERVMTGVTGVLRLDRRAEELLGLVRAARGLPRAE